MLKSELRVFPDSLAMRNRLNGNDVILIHLLLVYLLVALKWLQFLQRVGTIVR